MKYIDQYHAFHDNLNFNASFNNGFEWLRSLVEFSALQKYDSPNL